jgi:hypothetical protein
MKLRAVTLLILLLFMVNISTTSKANTETIINEGAIKIIEGLVGNIETATKGKKLQKFFSGNSIRLLIGGKTKEYKFQEKKYEVFEDGKLIESGKWKVSGLLKNQIKLNADDKSKAYYLKKINKKETLYHYDNLPSKKSTIKTLVTIESLIKKEETKVVKKKEEPKVEETKVVKKKEKLKVKKTKAIKKKEKLKVKKTKVVKKKNKKTKKKSKSENKYRYLELTKNQIKELNKIKERSKKITIIKSENNFIETTKQDTQGGQYIAAEHCAKSNLFAYSFKDSGYGEWYEKPFKRAKYFYCTNQLIFVNPFTNKEVSWTNYEKKVYFKYSEEQLFLYRKMTSTYRKLIEKEKNKNPKKFKTQPFKIIYKDENSIHIKGFPLGDLNKERYIANEHCSKFNKRYYFFEDSLQQGRFGSLLFSCSNKHMASNPFSGLPLQFVSGSENYSPESEPNAQGNLNASQMLKYNSTNNTTFYFFEASDNLMQSLELLYRAYDQNVEADKLKAQISYNRESKYSEQDKLESTRIIIDSSSKEINAQIADESKILSDVGRGYYEQSLPYAYNAAQNSYTLIMIIKNTFEKGTQGSGSFLEYANEFIGFFTIAKDLPNLANDIFTTSKLVFSGAKSKKIKDKGNLNKALDELDLSS